MNKILIRLTLILLLLAFIVIAVFGLVYIVNEYTAPIAYEETVTKYCFEYGVDANLVYATIKAESNFKEKAVSKKGAVGLMQLMPQTAHYVSLLLDEENPQIDLYDPHTNLKYGIYYLSYLEKKFKNIDLQILAYNAGEGNVANWKNKYFDGEKLSEIPFPESEAYLFKVKKYLNLYKRKYNY